MWVFLFLTGALTFVVGLILHLWTTRRMKAAQRWPLSTARIDVSTIKFVTTIHLGRPKGARLPGPTFAPDIRYRFYAAGREWSGNRLSYGDDNSHDRSVVEAMVARYPVGSTPPVRYNPANPARCALEAPPPTTSHRTTAIIGLVLAVAGCISNPEPFTRSNAQAPAANLSTR